MWITILSIPDYLPHVYDWVYTASDQPHYPYSFPGSVFTTCIDGRCTLICKYLPLVVSNWLPQTIISVLVTLTKRLPQCWIIYQHLFFLLLFVSTYTAHTAIQSPWKHRHMKTKSGRSFVLNFKHPSNKPVWPKSIWTNILLQFCVTCKFSIGSTGELFIVIL